MTDGGWPLILDGVILVLLAATVFLAARLSIQLKDFRESRRSMEGLVRDLARHVDKAQQAIEGLRESVREAGRDLHGKIREAQALTDELQIIIESGNNLASRLEQLAEKGARPSVRPGRFAAEMPRHEDAGAGPFAIRDPDFDDPLPESMSEDGTFPGEDDPEEAGASGGFYSRAERELFEALRKSKKEKA